MSLRSKRRISSAMACRSRADGLTASRSTRSLELRSARSSRNSSLASRRNRFRSTERRTKRLATTSPSRAPAASPAADNVAGNGGSLSALRKAKTDPYSSFRSRRYCLGKAAGRGCGSLAASEAELKRQDDDDPWHGGHGSLRGHHGWTCGRESHVSACGERLTADRYVSWLNP
jgi:hypothetical protein